MTQFKFSHFNWVKLILDTDLPPYCKFISLYLSTFMNMEQQMAFPSQSRMAKEMGISKATINKYLNLLEESKWLTRERGNSLKATRYFASFPQEIEKLAGSTHSSLYTPPSPPDGLPTRSSSTPHGRGSTPHGLGVVRHTDTNNNNNNKGTRGSTPHGLPPSHNTTSFDDFWGLYPKKSGKGAARTAFTKALKKTDASTIADAVKAHTQTDQWQKHSGKFIPNPATWLNQERWDDEIEGVSSSCEMDF